MLLAALLVILAGCSLPAPPVAAPSPAPSSPAKTAKLTPEALRALPSASQRYRLVLIVKTRNNPFFSPMIAAAYAQAAQMDVDLDVQSPAQETDKEGQFNLVSQIVARGVDAILIAPADSKGIVPALKAAQKQGVVVVNLDNLVDRATLEANDLELGGYISADNEAGGRLAGEEMVKALGGAGEVAVLEGIRGADNAEARKRGFQEAVDGKLTIVASETAEWETEKAYAKAQSLLAAHPNLRGLFAANDKMALGAVRAIKEAGKTGQITVIGYDNIPDVKPLLDSGAMHATIEQHPDRMGHYGVALAVGLLEKKVAPGGTLMAPLELIPGKDQ